MIIKDKTGDRLSTGINRYCYNPGMRTIEQGHRGAAPKRKKKGKSDRKV